MVKRRPKWKMILLVERVNEVDGNGIQARGTKGGRGLRNGITLRGELRERIVKWDEEPPVR
ncbi:MAG: hypothetical protein ACTS4T_01730 [Candidatus Hodgkinia cicadicola]